MENFSNWLGKKLWGECYYGGSFNPIHFGHIQCAKAEKNVILLPAGNPPHKQDLANFSDRLAMCRLVGAEYGIGVSAGDTGGPIINILRKLVPMWGKVLVPFLVGTDSIINLHSWVEADELAENILWVVAPRGNLPISNSKYPNLHIKRLEVKTMDISSTKIRELLVRKEYSILGKYLPQVVLDYIVRKKIYL